jgi:hypothetical protein
MKLNDLALIIIIFIVVAFLLSVFNIISLAITQILAYSLLVIGIALVYSETIRQNKLSVFLGSVIFLFGIYFLISENFNLNLKDEVYVSLILIFLGTGILILYITLSTKKILLTISLIFLSSGIALFIAYSNWNFKSFFASILPILGFLWPVIIIIAILVFLLRVR